MADERHFFIVARDETDLCEYLQREFSMEEGVQVFLDRRQGERRCGRERRVAPRHADTHDRRGAERRARPFVDSQLRALGYAMLRLG